MSEKKGKLYGIGVGPGDPQLMTLKAVDLIRSSDVIAVADSGKEENTYIAYNIAQGVVKNLEQKERMVLSMPMTKEKKLLDQSHEKAAAMVAEQLEKGKNVAFLTIGDPAVYSTYLYLHRILARNYEAEIVPGVPSFCAVAARLGEGLAETDRPLHIIPASYAETEKALSWQGTKILMKMGRSIDQVREILRRKDLAAHAKMVQNCGMPGEKVWNSLQDADVWQEQPGYFSMIVIKEDEKE